MQSLVDLDGRAFVSLTNPLLTLATQMVLNGTHGDGYRLFMFDFGVVSLSQVY